MEKKIHSLDKVMAVIEADRMEKERKKNLERERLREIEEREKREKDEGSKLFSEVLLVLEEVIESGVIKINDEPFYEEIEEKVYIEKVVDEGFLGIGRKTKKVEKIVKKNGKKLLDYHPAEVSKIEKECDQTNSKGDNESKEIVVRFNKRDNKWDEVKIRAIGSRVILTGDNFFIIQTKDEIYNALGMVLSNPKLVDKNIYISDDSSGWDFSY